MKRVSSRQRLVSWDAFEANADPDSGSGDESSIVGTEGDDDSDTSGYETAFSQSFNTSTSFDRNDKRFSEAEGDSVKTIRCRKRDRKSRRSSQQSNHTCSTNQSPKSNKSMTTIPSSTPEIIPSYSWELDNLSALHLGSTKTSTAFNSLIDDIHIHIFSFLDLSSLRSAMSLNHSFRKIILSNDARSSLWMNHCLRLWKIKWENHSSDQRHRHMPPKFVDNVLLPIAATTDADRKPRGEKDRPNLSLLLSLTPNNFPTCVDKDILTPRTRLRREIQHTIPTDREVDEDESMFYYKDESTGHYLIRYTGHVGQGDRCIRSNFPLPKPHRAMNVVMESTRCIDSVGAFGASVFGTSSTPQQVESHRPSFFNILKRYGPKSALRSGENSSKPLISPHTGLKAPIFRDNVPFVVPFVVTRNSFGTSCVVNVTPRFIAYYEATILKPNEKNVNNTGAQIRHLRPASHRTGHSDCVAVGIATKDFQFQSRMPGWDRQSFGYHGDDGGIFHASGGMLKQYGPKFGEGDTVGCGVDYISKSIFYTLNGKFLGYAWENVNDSILKRDLYPVVGIDTNCPIHLNWGSSGPFQFDLSSHIKKHEGIVLQTYSTVSSSDVTEDVKDRDNASSLKTARSFSGRTSFRRQRRSVSGRRSHRDRR